MKAPATFYTVRGGGDIHWRALWPAKHLGAKIRVIPNEKANDVFLNDHPHSRLFPWKLTEEGAVYPGLEGTAIWTRPDVARATHAIAMAMNGHRVLAEVDDNYLSDPNQNIFMRLNQFDEKGRNNHMRAFSAMDGIIFSTPKLRDIYVKAFRREFRKKVQPFVCRNHIDVKTWESRLPLIEVPTSRVRVGWAGSHQHVMDLRLAAPALRAAYDLGCEIVFIGLDPATSDPEWKDFLPEYLHIPWSDPDAYHTKTINIDIGLIPLVQNAHTDGKSDIKFLEYSMSGAATIATSSPIYNKTIMHGETGILVNSPDMMAHAVIDLVRNSTVRTRLARAAKQWVIENRSLAGNIQEWRDAIEG